MTDEGLTEDDMIREANQGDYHLWKEEERLNKLNDVKNG